MWQESSAVDDGLAGIHPPSYAFHECVCCSLVPRYFRLSPCVVISAKALRMLRHCVARITSARCKAGRYELHESFCFSPISHYLPFSASLAVCTHPCESAWTTLAVEAKEIIAVCTHPCGTKAVVAVILSARWKAGSFFAACMLVLLCDFSISPEAFLSLCLCFILTSIIAQCSWVIRTG